MRLHSAASFLALALLLAPAAAQAQDDDPHHGRGSRGRGIRQVDDDTARRRREGFWLSAGLGVGGESFDARDGLGWSDNVSGGVGYLKLGGTVSRSLLLGVELQGWGADFYQSGFSGVSYERALGSLMGIAQFYPAERSDFWLRGGLGVAVDQLRDHAGDMVFETNRYGSAVAIGLGYDIPVARKISITPSLDLVGQHYDTHNERLLTLGVGVTFH